MSEDQDVSAASYFTPDHGPHQEDAAQIRRAAQALRRQFSPSRQVQTDDLLNDAFIALNGWVDRNQRPPDQPVSFVRRTMQNLLLNRARKRRSVTFDDQMTAAAPADPDRSDAIQSIFVELDRSPDPAICEAMATFKLYHAFGAGRFSQDWATLTADTDRHLILKEVGARLGISTSTASRHVKKIKDELTRRLEADDA